MLYESPKEAEGAVLHFTARIKVLEELLKEAKEAREQAQIEYDVLDTENYLDDFDD